MTTVAQQNFIAAILPYALTVAQQIGVDPRIIIAQAALESAWGTVAPGNNYFGIKSHGQPNGQTFATTEYVDGQPTRTLDSFRQYGSLGESVADYGHFLTTNSRYRPMLEAQGLDAQLAALGASGYATDPNYAASVGQIARGLTLPPDAQGTALPPVYAAAFTPSTTAPAPSPAPAAAEPAAPASVSPLAAIFSRLGQASQRQQPAQQPVDFATAPLDASMDADQSLAKLRQMRDFLLPAAESVSTSAKPLDLASGEAPALFGQPQTRPQAPLGPFGQAFSARPAPLRGGGTRIRA